MRKGWRRPGLLAGCIFGGLLATAAAAAQTATWKTYSYAADGFSILFPATPEVSRKGISTAAGAVELHSYMAEGDSAALYIGVCDYGSRTNGASIAHLLESAKKSALDNTSAHLVTEKQIALGIYPGLEMEAENSQIHFTARIYNVGTTLYQALVVTPLGQPYAGATRFLDSFQLIARTAP